METAASSPGAPQKRPACDPCRRSKVACGHEQPVCHRCLQRGQSASCVYRDAPFKKRKIRHASQDEDVDDEQVPFGGSSPARRDNGDATPSHRYPNPGYLGSSSGFAIFNEVQSMSETPLPERTDSPYDSQGHLPGDMLEDQGTHFRATHVLGRLSCFDINELSNLVLAWLKTGANLALAQPFVLGCVHAMIHCPWRHKTSSLQSGSSEQARAFSQRAKSLSRNTYQPIALTIGSTIDDYLQQMSGPCMRWETLGIFFAAAAKAASDIEVFPSLYTSEERRRRLVRSLTYIGDYCLEICLAIDCLNDLQIVLQYEQFHMSSRIHGDQSFHTWRCMGDLATSVVTLGYHEKIDQQAAVPPFVLELRKSIFARIYWADKTLSVFMGRPPRILLAFCNFQVPHLTRAKDAPHDEVIDYVADTVCSAKFAVLKEASLDIFRMRHTNDLAERVSQARYDLEQIWLEMPPHFRLTGSLIACQGTPFEKDFLVNQRLEYLHTHFLLGLTSLQRTAEPDEELLRTSEEMLRLVVELMLLRNKIVNSGTCWFWKVAHFGLPAAGVISLALLRRSGTTTPIRNKSQMIQNLCVLVAEVKSGAVISPGEPSFELFTRATRTISSILDSSLTLVAPSRTNVDGLQETIPFDLGGTWNPDISLEPWDFEVDFWENLATHPTIAGMDDRAV